MITQVLSPSEGAICEAAKLIFEGELVGFPTETVYGLGANALDAEAVQKIFDAKGRPGDNPLIVHISHIQHLAPLVRERPSAAAKALIDAYWPGPMTLIFPKSTLVPAAVTAGLDTVAVRMPSHPVARRLIEVSALPIAAPSANRSGRPSPTTAKHVLEDMSGRIPLILDGGPCQVGLESTVIDVTGCVPRVLRPGGITPEMIARVAGNVEVDGSVMRPLKEGETPRSPGMKYRHYAPKGNLTIVQGSPDAVAREICRLYDEAKSPALILALQPNLCRYAGRKTISLGMNAEDMAHNLFDALRKTDEMGAEVIFSEGLDADGLGLAVMNRLGRAAAFHIVHAS